MPQIPNYTADVGQPGAASGRRATGEDFGAGVGRELQRLGRTGHAIAGDITRHEEQADQAQADIEVLRIEAQYAKELQRIQESGGDVEDLQSKFFDKLDEVRANRTTKAGLDRANKLAADSETRISNTTRKIEAARYGEKVKREVREFDVTLGNAVAVSPTLEGLQAAITRVRDHTEIFQRVPPNVRADIVVDRLNGLSAVYVDSMLRENPAALKQQIENGDIPGLTPAQTSKALSQAEAEIERQRDKANSLSQREKLDIFREWEARARSSVITNEEINAAVEAEILTANQATEYREASIRYEQERRQLADDVELITSSQGSTLSPDRYQAAIDKLVQDNVEGLSPEEAGPVAVQIRLAMAQRNGYKDGKLQDVMNAGARGDQGAFESGFAVWQAMRASNPALTHQMVTDDTRRRFLTYQYLIERQGLASQAAFNDLSSVVENAKLAKDVIGAKETQSALDGAVSDLETDTPLTRRMVRERAELYLATNPRMAPEDAIALAAEDVAMSTTVIDGVRVPRGAVPDRYEEAETYVRRLALKRELEAQGVKVTALQLDKMQIIPNSEMNGTATIVSESGRVLMTDFPLQGAVHEWIRERGAAEDERRAQRIEEEHRARQSQRKMRSDEIESEAGSVFGAGGA